MKHFIVITFLSAILLSCDNNGHESTFHLPDWSSRSVTYSNFDSLVKSTSYLPVYAQIYEMNQDRKVDLAATISIRNINLTDTVYLKHIDYYDTQGKRIRQYINAPIFLKPMETLELIIKSSDNEGGTGANFIFEAYSKQLSHSPLYEAIMISTSGQQGISFTSRGVEIKY